ncbi:histone-like nucleoid-structuring protein Lsr2 [Leucobacter sp. GX24907]
MAKRIITELIDDIDGAPNARTVSFGLEGADYEIELSEENLSELRNALSPYIAKARRAEGSAAKPRRRSGAASGARKEELQAIRAWARDNGHAVSDRGRIPGAVIEAYRSAH